MFTQRKVLIKREETNLHHSERHVPLYARSGQKAFLDETPFFLQQEPKETLKERKRGTLSVKVFHTQPVAKKERGDQTV